MGWVISRGRLSMKFKSLTMNKVKIELCAASVEAIHLAKKMKIDRIELCQNLEQGGMTPSPGFIEYALDYGIETHVLIRPRSGGFQYSEEEKKIMLMDIEKCRDIGVRGVVIGILNEQNVIDERTVSLMVQKAGDLDVTFHRAFDETYDFVKSIDQLVNAGVKRILSSGLARNVELGSENLKEMKAYAQDKIEIMIGGGVSAANVANLMRKIRPDAVHFSGTVKHLLDGRIDVFRIDSKS